MHQCNFHFNTSDIKRTIPQVEYKGLHVFICGIQTIGLLCAHVSKSKINREGFGLSISARIFRNIHRSRLDLKSATLHSTTGNTFQAVQSLCNKQQCSFSPQNYEMHGNAAMLIRSFTLTSIRLRHFCSSNEAQVASPTIRRQHITGRQVCIEMITSRGVIITLWVVTT